MSVFAVLAEPQRRRILDELRSGERPVGDLVVGLGLSQPLVSKHLRVLRDAGLVATKVDAQRRLYSVRPEALRELDRWLAPYRRMWAESLDDLERHLDLSVDAGPPQATRRGPTGTRRPSTGGSHARDTRPRP